MGATLAEFLREKAAVYGAEAKANEAIIQEWRVAIYRLYRQICEWIRQSDPEGVIKINEGERSVNEPGLGPYKVPSLNLQSFGTWIGLVPKARRTVGTATPPQKQSPVRATGRVDITDELRRYVLYRVGDNGNETWYINEPLSDRQVPLTRDTFEAALMSYLT